MYFQPCSLLMIAACFLCFYACSNKEPKADKQRNVIIENIANIDSLARIMKDESTSCKEKARLLESRKNNHAKPQVINFKTLIPTEENRALLDQFFQASRDLEKVADRYHEECKKPAKENAKPSSSRHP